MASASRSGLSNEDKKSGCYEAESKRTGAPVSLLFCLNFSRKALISRSSFLLIGLALISKQLH
jgi:hypothetical protein